jgi:pimeloyl-ACP methyl ester carboxylesterase
MDVAEKFHKELPNSELVTIKKCGHAPMIEHPEWFAENVKRFLAQHSRYHKTAAPA